MPMVEFRSIKQNNGSRRARGGRAKICFGLSATIYLIDSLLRDIQKMCNIFNRVDMVGCWVDGMRN